MLYNVFKGIQAGVEVPKPTPPPGLIRHTVVAGDTLYLLAQRYGTTVNQIMLINSLTSTILNIGQQLLIPII